MKTTSRFAVAAAASMLATGAMAADLGGYGGNCCADLEERVAELEATTARKGNRKVSLTVYGQVNQAILWHDDEDGYREGKATIRDNGASMSRFGFRGEAKIRPDLTAGYNIEFGLSNNDFGTGGENITIRHNYLYLDSQRLGRVSLGQTSQVTDGLYEISLANTLITPGGMDEAEFALSGEFVDTFSNGFDGGRKQGVYYRTPSVAGFMLSTGYSHDTGRVIDSKDYWEVALRYAGEFNGVRIAAGIGYRAMEDDLTGNDSDTILGSASVMHTPTGLFVSGGYAETEFDDRTDDKQGYWVMAGIEKNFFGPGTTTLFGEYSAVEFKHNTLIGPDNHDGTYWGLGVVQKIDAAAMDLYLNFRNYEIDSTGWGQHWADEPSKDASVVVGGAIIRF